VTARTHFDPRQPYNALPDPPPDDVLETRDLWKRCTEARVAVEMLRQAGKAIPNQAMLTNTIPVLEAQASSEIENVVTTSDRLFRFAVDDAAQADPATREALRYRTALRRGFESIQRRPLCTATAVEVCRVIQDQMLDIRRVPGTRLANPASGEVVYTPPEGEGVIRDKLGAWERLLHERESLDPLIRMAAGHYQFEAIHPFTDGNGRTGRVLNILYLVDQGLLDMPVLYLSRYLIRHRADYYDLLLAVTREGRWHDWLRFMLVAVEDTARWTTAKIEAVQRLISATAEHVRRRAPGVYSRELVELLFVQPYCRIADVVAAGLAHRQTASKHLSALREIGVLSDQKVGRERLFLNTRLHHILTADTNDFEPFPVGA
jgi:Fic family protein